MKIKDIISHLEQWAPPAYQESYDNSGLLVGSREWPVTGVLITLDVTEEVIAEAKVNQCNLIVAHHPLIFKGLKRINGSHWVERCVIAAIKNDIAIYAIHTNLDHVYMGVNRKIAERLELTQLRILTPKNDVLTKLVTFVPASHREVVLSALYDAGAGQIGEYDHCSFQLTGTGTYRPSAVANPFHGTHGQDEKVTEERLELLIPSHLNQRILAALRKSHPYEEVAYYLTPLSNAHQEVGAGMVGKLTQPMDTVAFLQRLKERMQTKCIRYTALCKNEISTVAVCGGAGSFLLGAATAAGADVLVTADFKYHDFFEADRKIIVADIGHYESEQFTKDLLFDNLKEKFTNIALVLTKVDTNPVNYL